MPLHIHPWFRNREKACENAGLLQALNSVGYTEKAAAEAAGESYEQIPVALTFKFNGTNYTASE